MLSRSRNIRQWEEEGRGWEVQGYAWQHSKLEVSLTIRDINYLKKTNKTRRTVNASSGPFISFQILFSHSLSASHTRKDGEKEVQWERQMFSS